MMKWIFIVMMVVVFLALLVLTLGNTHSVDFNIIGFPSTHWPLVVYLWLAFVIGAVVGVLSMFGRLLQLRSEAARLQKELKKIQQQNSDLITQLNQQQPDAIVHPAEIIVPVQP